MESMFEYKIDGDLETLPVPLVRLIIGYIGRGYIGLALDMESRDAARLAGSEGDMVVADETRRISSILYRRVIVGGILGCRQNIRNLITADMKDDLMRESTAYGDYNIVLAVASAVGVPRYKWDPVLPESYNAAPRAVSAGDLAVTRKWVRHYMQYNRELETALSLALLLEGKNEMLDIFVEERFASWEYITSRTLGACLQNKLEYIHRKFPTIIDSVLISFYPKEIQHVLYSGKLSGDILKMVERHRG